MEGVFSLVSWYIGQAVARFPGLHLASVHRLENGLDVGWWGPWLEDPMGMLWHAEQYRLAGKHLQGLRALGMVTGGSLNITPKPRRNTCPRIFVWVFSEQINLMLFRRTIYWYFRQAATPAPSCCWGKSLLYLFAFLLLAQEFVGFGSWQVSVLTLPHGRTCVTEAALNRSV